MQPKTTRKWWRDALEHQRKCRKQSVDTWWATIIRQQAHRVMLLIEEIEKMRGDMYRLEKELVKRDEGGV